MFVVHCEFGPVAEFETGAEAEAFADRENAADGEGTYWVLYSFTVGGGSYPKG